MDTKLIALRNDLMTRRGRLYEKGEAIEEEIRKLNGQVETINSLIQNITGVRQELAIKAPPARVMTTREVLETLRGKDGFTAPEVLLAGERLPIPVKLKLDSVRAHLSKMKINGDLKDWGKDDSGNTIYDFR
jgi:hypothetical protein